MQRPPADISVNYASIRRDRQSLASWSTGLLPEREQYASCPYSPQLTSGRAGSVVIACHAEVMGTVRAGADSRVSGSSQAAPSRRTSRSDGSRDRWTGSRSHQRDLPARPGRHAPWPTWLEVGSPAGTAVERDRCRRPVDASGGGCRRLDGRAARGAHHRDGVGEVAGLPAARGDGGGRGRAGGRRRRTVAPASGDIAVSGADQGAGPRPGPGVRRARRCPAGGSPRWTATPTQPTGSGRGTTPITCSPTRTCCTPPCCRTTPGGPRSCAPSGSWWWTSRTAIGGCSALR